MPFTPRYLDSYTFNEQARAIIHAGEGSVLLTVDDIGDDTATIGYGYTLVRKDDAGWSVYEHIVADMAAIGIVWTSEHRQNADNVASALTSGNLNAAHAAVSALSVALGAISEANAQELFEREFDRARDFVESQLTKHLGAVAGPLVFSNLALSRELWEGAVTRNGADQCI